MGHKALFWLLWIPGMHHGHTYVDAGKISMHMKYKKREIFLKVHYIGLLITNRLMLTTHPWNLEDIWVWLA